MKSATKNIQLASYDDLFKTDEERQADAQERIQNLPLDKLEPFPNHPFKVIADDKMLETVESIKERGVLVPILVRPKNDGNFEIVAPYSKATLVFSYVGYQPKEVSLKGERIVNVKMVEDAKALEEVVVVGYTTQRKATITGSVATITTKDLKQSPTANLTNALAGRMPGLMANQFSGGEPGVDGADLRIRGASTYGDQTPIFIIDGVERDDMAYLAPEEIETLNAYQNGNPEYQPRYTHEEK